MQIRETAEIADLRVHEMKDSHKSITTAALAARLRTARKFKKWSQQDLANRAGTTQAVIQKIENGKSLRPRNIEAIAEALDVEPAWLMFGSGPTARLSKEAVAVAKVWAELHEPDRSAIRQTILKLSSGKS